MFWHVRLGHELAEQGQALAGRLWSFTVANDDWRSTQWLAELAMAELEATAGWNGLLVFKGLGVLGVLSALAWSTLRGVPARAGVLAYVLAALAASSAFLERPMLWALIPLPLVARMWLTAVQEARWPRWWLLLPAVVLYANIHGLWVLVPATLGMAAFGRWLDHGLRDTAALQGAALAVLSTSVGAISPLGIANITAVFAFRDATRLISEWQPTDVSFGPTWMVGALTGLAIVAWARGPRACVPRSEVLFILSVSAFSASALRNLAPAAMLLAPVVARRIALAWDVRAIAVGQREARALRVATTTILVGAVAVAGVGWWVRDPLPTSLPSSIAQGLDARDEPIRLFNEYNVAGAVLGFTDQVTLGIDGRSDYYGGDYIADYLDVIAAKPGSFERFLAADPDAALLAKTAPLTDVLRGRGWTITDREGDWVLLEPPAD